MIYLDLFLSFLKLGAFTFGGGYAMIPMIREIVVSKGWLEEAQLLNFIAVAESTPGPVAINMATFVGSSQAGVLGALMATIGVVLPSFVIIVLISSVIRNFLKYRGVQAFLGGVRPVVVALITGTALTMLLDVVLSIKTVGTPIVFDWRAALLIGILLLGGALYKRFRKKALPPIGVILFSAAFGLIFYL